MSAIHYILFIYVHSFSRNFHLQFWVGLQTPNHGRMGSDMVLFEKALVSSYRPSIVTFPLSWRVLESGVGAQSTLGPRHFCPQNMYEKLTKCPNFTCFKTVFVRKIIKITEFLWYFPEKNFPILHDFCPKDARILHKNCPKFFFQFFFFWGGRGTCPLPNRLLRLCSEILPLLIYRTLHFFLPHLYSLSQISPCSRENR